MTDKATLDEAEFFAKRGFGLRIGFGNNPALIIIDMAKAFTDETAVPGSNLDAQIAATAPLLEVAHARNVPVFFSTGDTTAMTSTTPPSGPEAKGASHANRRTKWRLTGELMMAHPLSRPTHCLMRILERLQQLSRRGIDSPARSKPELHFDDRCPLP
jgi:hypothetical protein